MSTEDARRFFDDVARSYDRRFAPSARETAEDLERLLRDVASGSKVLDVGCGTGRAWPHLVARELHVVALDASMPMLRESSKRASSAAVTRLRADLYAPWPIADRSVDVVLALHAVLAHPPVEARRAWAHVGSEIARVSKSKTLVVVDLPTPEWARANLSHLGDDRYLTPEGVVAVVPDPHEVARALGLPFVVGAAPLGARLTLRS